MLVKAARATSPTARTSPAKKVAAVPETGPAPKQEIRRAPNLAASPLIFDPQFYLDANPDLGRAGITSEEQLREHWLNHGFHEGRQAAVTFDPEFYLRSNPDLVAAGFTRESATEHFFYYGRNEIRPTSRYFDAAYYAEQNRDLVAAGFHTTESLQEHWRLHGITEGRPASLNFDWEWYRDRYPDLVRAGVDTQAEALFHHSRWGRFEGRETSALRQDLAFGQHGLTLDVYQPPNPTGSKVPVVINLVGGGWASAENDHPILEAEGREFAANGIAMVAPQYRTAPQNKYPDQLNDVSEVLRYVRDNAEANNWDLDNITLMGGSAGAHMALLHALNPEFNDQPDLPNVRNVVAVAPQTDNTVDLLEDSSPANDSLAHLIEDFLGPSQQLRVESSPITYANRLSDSRFYLSYGDQDPVTPAPEQIYPFLAQMQVAGQDITIDRHPSLGHGEWLDPRHPNFDPLGLDRIIDWIRQGA